VTEDNRIREIRAVLDACADGDKLRRHPAQAARLEWQAAVDRARRERARQHTEGTNP
jgi:hypothetical protein